jgi:4-azaleucine resistance transporter AzlC
MKHTHFSHSQTPSSDTSIPDSTNPWLRGLVRALPIVLGYIPIGFAYGVLAQQAGLSTVNTLLMSLIVYAGSSQLIAVGLFSAGVPGLTIILTTFIVNLRHMLFSAALSPYLRGWRKMELALFAYELTDESFALHSVAFAEKAPVKAEALAINMTAQVSWIAGSALGALAGQLVSDVKPLALDYTLPAMFIALLVMQLKSKTEILIALATGAICVIFSLIGLNQWSVILATMIGASLGVGLEVWLKERIRRVAS